MIQENALDILKMGHNVYLTGAAGSGKTYVLNKYIEYLRKHNIDVGVTASTGIAATHMGGVTIHSFTGLGVRSKLSGQDLAGLLEKQYLYKRLERLKVLIIDEISMMHHFRLDMVDELLRAFKGNELPFGGIQVVLCGDFFQLPPVSRKGEAISKFIYHSKVWRTAKFKICYLEEQHRQTDDASLRILNDIRNNEVTEDTFELLQTRFKFKHTSEGSEEYETVIEQDDIEVSKTGTQGTMQIREDIVTAIEPTRLFTHNADVDTINDDQLENIDEEEFEYYMQSSGKDILVELLKKSCLAPEVLRLKLGAKVMFVKNNFEAGYVNGTLGIVTLLDESGITVTTMRGDIVKVETTHWDVEEDGKVLASIVQYPLRLAWAITIHKSQGMSLDAVEVDLSKSFEKGMGYVALSRVRTLDGLTILGINDNALRVNDEVMIVDEKLKTASRRAVDELEKMSPKQIEKAQKEFASYAATAEKASKVSTYELTRQLIEKRVPLKRIAKERGVTEETIIDHIEKLVEEDSDFIDTASYIRSAVPYKKQVAIREAFAKANPAIAEETGESGTVDFEAGVYRACPLSPVKKIVGSKASFKDIRIMRVLG